MTKFEAFNLIENWFNGCSSDCKAQRNPEWINLYVKVRNTLLDLDNDGSGEIRVENFVGLRAVEGILDRKIKQIRYSLADYLKTAKTENKKYLQILRNSEIQIIKEIKNEIRDGESN